VVKGFLATTVRSLKVDPARETNVPIIKLEVGAVTQTVEVSANIQTVQTANAEVSTTITRAQIANLPVVSRSPLAFIQTQAGVVNGRSTTTING